MKLPEWFLSGAGCSMAPRLCSAGVNGEWVVGGWVGVRLPDGEVAPPLPSIDSRGADDVRRLILAAGGTLNATVSLPYIRPGRDGVEVDDYLVTVGGHCAEMRHVALVATLYPGCRWSAAPSDCGLVPVYAFSDSSIVGMVQTIWPPKANPKTAR